jgi:uncharacterized protein involved in exopolysaccharide biosynthesis
MSEVKAPDALARWKRDTAPELLARRKWWLWTGFALLMAAAAIQALVAVAKYIGQHSG